MLLRFESNPISRYSLDDKIPVSQWKNLKDMRMQLSIADWAFREDEHERGNRTIRSGVSIFCTEDFYLDESFIIFL